MTIVLTILHVLVCLFLIIVVLLQSGKAADLAGAFGGMGSQTAFGARGAATVLSKATTVAAALFMFTALTLSIVGTRNQGSTSSILDQHKPAPKQEQKGATPGYDPTKPSSVEIFPEGGDPSKAVRIPLPIPPKPPEQKQGGAGEQKK
jgi:preprotein translocase subunit SecG